MANSTLSYTFGQTILGKYRRERALTYTSPNATCIENLSQPPQTSVNPSFPPSYLKQSPKEAWQSNVFMSAVCHNWGCWVPPPLEQKCTFYHTFPLSSTTEQNRNAFQLGSSALGYHGCWLSRTAAGLPQLVTWSHSTGKSNGCVYALEVVLPVCPIQSCYTL